MNLSICRPLIAWLILISCTVSGQESAMYFPVKEGTVLEMRQYDPNNKLKGYTLQKVVKKTVSGRDISVEVNLRSFTEKGKEQFNRNLVMKCKNGVFYMDLKGLIPQEMNLKGEGMDIKVEGAELKIPGKLVPGQKLEDAELKISMLNQGMVVMSLKFSITNRRVEKVEKMTTPAGTFECFKISQEMENKSMKAVKIRSIDWMAKNIGIVRNETYNSKNKLAGYSVLTSIK